MKEKTITYAVYIVLALIIFAIAGPILITYVRGYLNDIGSNRPTYPATSYHQTADPAEPEIKVTL